MEIRRSEKLTSAFGSGELKSSEILNTCIRDGIHYTYAVIAKLSSRLLIFLKIKSPRYFSEYGEKGVEIPIVHAHMINSSVRLIKVRLELQVF